MIDKAIELKKEQPRRCDETINQFLQHEFQATIPKSTLYRHLKRAGATRLKLGVAKQKVRRRWTRDQSNALWLGDFEDGPYVLEGDRAVETHLSAFIDCHSRYVVEARYYFRENLDILIDSLLRAWAVHGASRELYLDNAKIYHAHALKAACLALNIRLLHRGVGDPPPRRTDRTLLRDGPDAVRKRSAGRRNPHAGAAQPRLLRLAGGELPPAAQPETGQSPRLRYEPAVVHPPRRPAAGAEVLPQARRAAASIRTSPTCGSRASSSASTRSCAATGSKSATIPSAIWKPS